MNELLKKLQLTPEQYKSINVSPVVGRELWNIHLMLTEMQAIQPFNNLRMWFVTGNDNWKGKSPYDYINQSDDIEAAIDEVSMVVQAAMFSVKPNYAKLNEQARSRRICQENIARLSAVAA